MDHNIILKIQEITLRPVGPNDLEKMRRWRNSASARSFFLNSEVISEEQQKAWFESYLIRPGDYMFIIQFNNVDVGTVALYHVDYALGTSEFGRLLLAEDIAKGKKIGEKVTKAMVDFAMNDLNLKEVILEVFTSNLKAVHIYEKVGFKIIDKYIIRDRELYKMIRLGEQHA
ncbi:GNAT family N-acetyltransferase [Paenibacillus sp. NPDC058910]|uniref:GNAT family N-acetyltransferase n=1 Tax=unclassified Paenibacillus TaxID=185978 RepID=UPI0036AFD000